jgi:ABC-type dipeptide/oligopeptide/nickel transport system permease subunit
MSIDKKSHGAETDESLDRTRKQSMFMQVMKRVAGNKGAVTGLGILLVVFLASFIVPIFCRYGVNEMNLMERFNAPSLSHLFGTDAYGRDIFVRVLYGGRFSLLLGLSGALFGLFVGVVLGLINGYIGGTFDTDFMRIVDIWASIPGLLLAITISTVLGPGFINTIIALSIGSVPLIIRLLRGQILSVRHEEYLEAATSINAGPVRIMFKHMLPNVVAPVIVNTTMGIGSIINEAAALSYLGLGIQPPNPEWGAMLTAGKTCIQFYPWLVVFPGCAIALVVLSINMFGDGLRDAIDPKLKR